MPAVDLVLMTHHHRDQAAGCHRLSGEGIELGVSDQVAHWFEDADGTWQRQQILDLYDCTNLFDRPLEDVPVDRRLRDYERLTWEDLSIEVLPTPGHTQGLGHLPGGAGG